MPRIRSLLTKVKIERARHAHNCQGNNRHRLENGDVRLAVKNGRAWDNYCALCGLTILRTDLQSLQEIEEQLQSLVSDT